ncbi:CYTH domain-containing protein [Planctobacterium marinum]|uniref:CYTH domain-containing protein n=1 Tax=Planctobacterium marinum TaxID=1631968 RepID=A0AA48KTB3_9ALTE|nr:hypothetical protein MACH26_28750 [Planctobacterium marinum]
MSMHSEWEIERKFIVSEIPEGLLEPRTPKEIRQGYLALESEKEIRIRDKGGKYTMTIKQGKGLKRLETQIALSQEQFDTLWPLTMGMRVEKRRYDIKFLSHVLSLDLYYGELEPLMTLEVEFNSEEASQEFLPPDFTGQEVTTDQDYKNANLACFGLPGKFAAL